MTTSKMKKPLALNLHTVRSLTSTEVSQVKGGSTHPKFD